MESPKPNVSIEEQFQSRRASMSFSSMTGDTMSPTMSIVSFMEPIQPFSPGSGDGGTISATGLPQRVIRRGFLVWRTCSSSARHLALNSEMTTYFMDSVKIYRGSIVLLRLCVMRHPQLGATFPRPGCTGRGLP